ncbi:MAG: globin domain-containing protein [Pseudomonadota bacterium]
MLTPEEQALLRGTPLVMLESREAAATSFYETLFVQCPELRAMFPKEMSEMARKFSATLVIAINSLNDWEALRPVIEALARRHLSYGVQLDHYALVRRALMASLERISATHAEVAVWARVYDHLAEHMIATAYPEAP